MSPAKPHSWLKKVSPEEFYWRGEKEGRGEGRRRGGEVGGGGGRGEEEEDYRRTQNYWVKLTRASPEKLGVTETYMPHSFQEPSPLSPLLTLLLFFLEKCYFGF